MGWLPEMFFAQLGAFYLCAHTGSVHSVGEARTWALGHKVVICFGLFLFLFFIIKDITQISDM